MSDFTEEEFRDKIADFLRRNFPQIQMHGGDFAVPEVDPENGEVTIQLGGACEGCGISPMTVEALKTRLPRKIDAVTTVTVTGMGGTSFDSGLSEPTPQSDPDSESGPEAPF